MHSSGARWRPCRQILSAALSLSTLAMAAMPAHAAAAGQSGPPAIFAFSDSLALPDVSTLAAEAEQGRGRICAGGGPRPVTSLSLGVALAHAQAFLAAHAGSGALAALATGPQARSAGAAEAGSAAAVIAGSPAAALAAELLAHRLAPSDPGPLVNAAALLTTLGLPNEALAFLDAADALPSGRTAPLGISLHAVSLDNRGYALLALRRWQDAEQPLRTAAALSPHLSEAAANLSQAYLCAGDTARAVRFFGAGARRDTFQGDIVDTSSEPPGMPRQPPAAEIFDLSAGVERQLPDLKYPSTPEQAVAMYPVYHQLEYMTLLAVGNARNAQENGIYARLPRDLNPATLQRTQDIMAAIGGAYLVPGLHELWARTNTDNQEVGAIIREYWGKKVMIWEGTIKDPEVFKQTCTSSLPAAHGHWLAAMRALDRDTRRWWQAYSKYATGLAANLSNPAYHALAESQIARVGEVLYYSMLLGALWFWTAPEWQLRHECVQGEGAASPDLNWPGSQADTPPAPECPPGLRAVEHLSINLGFVSLNANCEQISSTLESEGLIKGFISGQYNTHGKELTVVVGAKVGVSVPGLSAEAGGGFYVTRNANGIKDWGIRLGASGSTSGLVSYEAISGETDISLAGSVDYIPTAFGLAN